VTDQVVTDGASDAVYGREFAAGSVPVLPAADDELGPEFPEAIVAVDPDGRITSANSGAGDLFGYAWNELAHRRLEDLILVPADLPGRADHPDDLPAAARDGVELECVRKDGSAFEAELSMTPFDTEDGRLVSVAIRDIGRRNRAVERMRWLSAIVENAHSPIISATVDGVITSWNTAAERVYGYPAAEIVGRPLATLAAPGATDVVVGGLHRAARGEHLEIPDARALAKNGDQLTLQASLSPMVDVDGRIVGVSVANRDLTERERAEAKFRWLLDATAMAIIGVGDDGLIRIVNAEARRMFDYEPGELIGQPVEVLVPAGLRTAHVAHRQAYAAHPRTRLMAQSPQLAARRKDGSEFPAEISLSSIVTDEGRLVAATVADISQRLTSEAERARLENELQRSQRLESLGQLAGGVAHDFNNVLAIILTHASLVEEDMRAGGAGLAEAQRALEQVQQAAERGARLTRQLLAFGRREVVRPQVFDVNHIIDDVERMLTGTLGAHVRLTTSTAPDLWAVTADPGRIEQVLVNLAVNARDAMPRGGTLQMSTENAAFDSDQAARRGLAAGRYVQIQVSDTGTGMSPEVADRAFEPFFTTKAEGHGTGLGLASVYGIVSQAAGTVALRSRPGRGTTVTILLPASDGVMTARPETSDPDLTAVAAERPEQVILVIDDEPDLRRSIEIILGRGGYAVLSAGSGEEADELARAYVGEIDLVLTDVTMPGMSGQEVAELIRGRRPTTRVLYMSGFAQALLASKGTIGPGETLVEKPFTRRSLLAKVSEALRVTAG
jgi:hypothetical protein